MYTVILQNIYNVLSKTTKYNESTHESYDLSSRWAPILEFPEFASITLPQLYSCSAILRRCLRFDFSDPSKGNSLILADIPIFTINYKESPINKLHLNYEANGRLIFWKQLYEKNKRLE